MLDTTICEMRFSRTKSQFRLQRSYKPERECEGSEDREGRSVDMSGEHLRLLLL